MASSKPSQSQEFYSRNKTELSGDMDDVLSDPRFAHIASDPRYRNAPMKEIKVQLDSRFKVALTNENFNTKSLMDPRGRPKSYGTKQKLDKFYSLASSDEDGCEEEPESENDADGHLEKATKSEPSKVREDVKARKFLSRLLDPEKDLARGFDFYSDDSSDDDSTTTDEDEPNEEDLEEFEWGELDGDAEWDKSGNDFEETHRFAVCNMDWDNVKAVDLMMLFKSFVPAGGAVNSVSILPSDYGKKRLEEEEVSGPQELVRLVASKKKCNELMKDLEDIEKGTMDESAEATLLQLEALRKYQRNRMLYFYAVVECDSVDTARAIYKECDRMLFELSGVILDLRYIPNDLQFDQVPRDVCEKTLDSYQQKSYHSTGFNASKPSLSWDETDRRRTNAIGNVMNCAIQKKEFDDNLIKDFIALSGEDDDDEDDDDKDEDDNGDDTDEQNDSDEEDGGIARKEKRIAKFRALVSQIEEKEQKKKQEKLVFDSEESEKADDDNSERESDDDQKSESLTPFETYLTKRRNKKKERMRCKKKIDDKSDDAEIAEKNKEVKKKNVKEGSYDLNADKSRKKREDKQKRKEEDKPEELNTPLSLLVMDEEENNKKHFDMRRINEEKKNTEKKNKKGKRKNEDLKLKDIEDFKVDSSDPRFSNMFTHGRFNLDPSHSRYNTHSSFSAIATQSPKKQKLDNIELKAKKTLQQDSDVLNLVNKIKRKTGKK